MVGEECHPPAGGSSPVHRQNPTPPLLDGLSVWPFDRSGTWTLEHNHYFNRVWGLDVGDIDGDGWLDIAVTPNQFFRVRSTHPCSGDPGPTAN